MSLLTYDYKVLFINLIGREQSNSVVLPCRKKKLYNFSQKQGVAN